MGDKKEISPERYSSKDEHLEIFSSPDRVLTYPKIAGGKSSLKGTFNFVISILIITAIYISLLVFSLLLLYI